MLLRSLTSVALGVTLAVASSETSAAFDYASDFSISSNPNGFWTYGYSTTLTAPLTLYTVASTNADGLIGWSSTIANSPIAGGNPTDKVVTSLGSIVYQPDQFVLHPGSLGQYSRARLTLATNDTYSIVGAFSGIDRTGTTTDVHVLVNGVSVYDALVNGFGSTASFSLTAQLPANSTIDFAVGYGSNRTWFFDTTALTANVSPVPEPGGLALTLFGLVALGGVFRRRV